MREPPLESRDDRQRIMVQRRRIAKRTSLQPMMVELDPFHVEAVEAERMHVAVAETGPIDEFDAEFVGRVCRADEVVLVDLKQAIEQLNLGDGCLADADGADFIGFDQLDVEIGTLAHDRRYSRGRHPPGRSATDDDQLADPVLSQNTNSGSPC